MASQRADALSGAAVHGSVPASGTGSLLGCHCRCGIALFSGFNPSFRKYWLEPGNFTSRQSKLQDCQCSSFLQAHLILGWQADQIFRTACSTVLRRV